MNIHNTIKTNEPLYISQIFCYSYPLVSYRFFTGVCTKNIADNYSDGLHIRVAHPGLTRLFGRSYGVEAKAHVSP